MYLRTWLVPALALTVVSGVQAEVIYWPMEGLNLAKQRAQTVQCCNNLKQIVQMAHLWANDNGDHCPPDFQTLLDPSASPSVLFCPENVTQGTPTNWAGVDWSDVDYEWIPVSPLVHWSATDPSAICCRCKVHENVALADGSVRQLDGLRSGWPTIVTGPMPQQVTPGSDVVLQAKVAPSAQAPLTCQWRSERPYYVTNVTSHPDLDDPHVLIWTTNRSARFEATPLPGQTNLMCLLPKVTTNNAGYYSVAVSNALGVAASAPVLVQVDSMVPSMAVDETWRQRNCQNNLNQLGLMARIWALDHTNAVPQNLAEMTNSYGVPLLGWPAALYCRSDGVRTAPADWPGVDFTDTSYEVVGGDPADSYDAFCKCRVHGFYVQMDGAVVCAPSFEAIRLLNDGTTQVSFRAFTGKTNLVEASPDLLTWTQVATYPSAHGSVVYSETNRLGRRFYRIRLP